MLKDILIIINRDGYISRSQLAKELNLPKEMIDQGISQLLRMGYLIEEETGADCVAACAKCPFAKNCGKEIVKTFKMSDRGKEYLKKGT